MSHELNIASPKNNDSKIPRSDDYLVYVAIEACNLDRLLVRKFFLLKLCVSVELGKSVMFSRLDLVLTKLRMVQNAIPI